MAAYRCPVCDGRGLMPAGFYPDTDPGLDAVCRGCEGTGVVYGPEAFPAGPPFSAEDAEAERALSGPAWHDGGDA